jgi:hypothetical protein
MIPAVPPISVSRPLLFGLLAAGAVAAVALDPPHSSFAAGFAAGAGAVFVISFMKRADGESPAPPADDAGEGPR